MTSALFTRARAERFRAAHMTPAYAPATAELAYHAAFLHSLLRLLVACLLLLGVGTYLAPKQPKAAEPTSYAQQRATGGTVPVEGDSTEEGGRDE